MLQLLFSCGWRDGLLDKVSALRTGGHGFECRPGTADSIVTLGKLFTPMCLSRQAV